MYRTLISSTLSIVDGCVYRDVLTVDNLSQRLTFFQRKILELYKWKLSSVGSQRNLPSLKDIIHLTSRKKKYSSYWLNIYKSNSRKTGSLK